MYELLFMVKDENIFVKIQDEKMEKRWKQNESYKIGFETGSLFKKGPWPH